MKKDDKNPLKDLNITQAPQEAIRFNSFLIELFISKILGIRSFMITDDSYVSDFLPTLAGDGREEGDYFLYDQIQYDAKRAHEETGKLFFQLNKKEREKYRLEIVQKVHRSEVVFEQDLIDQTKDLFGVEITKDHLQGSLVDLGKHLSSNITAEKRHELDKKYAKN